MGSRILPPLLSVVGTLVLIFAGALGLNYLEHEGSVGSAEGATTVARAPQRSRPAAPLKRSSNEVQIAWVGDITPGSKYGMPPNGGRDQFANVAGELRSADLTIGNLEGTLGSTSFDKCGESDGSTCFAFQAPTSMTGTLKSAGFNVFNLANNHALDYGAEGQAETVSALNAHGLRHTGRPGEILFVERKGMRIAIVGFAPYAWASPLLNVEEAASEVATAADQADVVVVLIHAGAEGADKAHVPHGDESMMGEDRGNSREFAQAAVNAGADLVLGSGPHVLRGIEKVGSGVIAYSAGDFSGYNNFGTHGALGLSGIFKFNVAKTGKVSAGRFVSVRLSKAGVPYLDSSGSAGRFVSKLSSADFGASGVQVGRNGGLRLN